ncbi:TetR/AcrR family transcriptional regulator [Limnohabitans sp. Rim28]|jgi:AcrR family transcriptional regulator|uniref:TetR/AcrR family transcriptional regulator n=1 Tax=Limnohabitans sp. Rim28 TaxID=1100720 RepID=UPI0002DAAC82|nr:TetR/AcrR family transcriptional regulator [Limnohabitans sp. Rim28]PVE08938.1 TetR family transcriptional regulator [Limnohabitans sp. Rim28]
MSELAEPKRARGRPRKTEGERDDGNRRQALIAAAAQLFHRKGYDATSTREIAALVGMQPGSPFYHFGNKQDLLLAVMVEGMKQASQRQTAACAGLADELTPREQLRALIRNQFDVLLGPDSDFIPVMLYEWRSLSAEQRQTITQIKDGYEAVWTPVLQALHDSRQLQAPVGLARLMIFGALNWAVQWYQPTGQNLTPTGAKHSVKGSSQTAAKATGPSAPRASLDDLTEAALALFLREPA